MEDYGMEDYWLLKPRCQDRLSGTARLFVREMNELTDALTRQGVSLNPVVATPEDGSPQDISPQDISLTATGRLGKLWGQEVFIDAAMQSGTIELRNNAGYVLQRFSLDAAFTQAAFTQASVA